MRFLHDDALTFKYHLNWPMRNRRAASSGTSWIVYWYFPLSLMFIKIFSSSTKTLAHFFLPLHDDRCIVIWCTCAFDLNWNNSSASKLLLSLLLCLRRFWVFIIVVALIHKLICIWIWILRWQKINLKFSRIGHLLYKIIK